MTHSLDDKHFRSLLRMKMLLFLLWLSGHTGRWPCMRLSILSASVHNASTLDIFIIFLQSTLVFNVTVHLHCLYLWMVTWYHFREAELALMQTSVCSSVCSKIGSCDRFRCTHPNHRRGVIQACMDCMVNKRADHYEIQPTSVFDNCKKT